MGLRCAYHTTVSRDTFHNTQRSERTSQAAQRDAALTPVREGDFDINSQAEVGAHRQHHRAERHDDRPPTALTSPHHPSAILPASAPGGVFCLANRMTLDPAVKMFGCGGGGGLSYHQTLAHISSCHQGVLCLIHDEPICFAELAEYFLWLHLVCVCRCVSVCVRE